MIIIWNHISFLICRPEILNETSKTLDLIDLINSFVALFSASHRV